MRKTAEVQLLQTIKDDFVVSELELKGIVAEGDYFFLKTEVTIRLTRVIAAFSGRSLCTVSDNF